MKNPLFDVSKWLNFSLERQFVKGTHIQLFFVIALIGLISAMGGLLVLPAGEPTDSFGESIWWAFLRLSDPGYLGDDEGMWRRIISTFLTVAGYVVFMGSMVAIITSWLNRKIRTLEQGLTPVSANNHVVILGWTNRTVHIASELFQSNKRVKNFLKRHGARTLKLIILSDDVTPFRLQELKDHPRIGKRAKDIILRSGEPIDREHLRRVDCLNASAIILPSPFVKNQEFITPDVETIKTLLSLNAEGKQKINKKKLPYVVAEIQDENKVKAAYRAYRGPLEVLSSDTIISRLIAQNVHHKGLSSVFNELLSHSINNNLYVWELPQAAGKPFGSLPGLFKKSILLGIVREFEDGYQPLLNPDRKMTLEETDRFILLARKMDDIEISPDLLLSLPASNLANNTHTRPENDLHPAKSSILILGWNHHIPALIKELGTYQHEEFHLTMASLRSIEERNSAISHILSAVRNVTCKQVVADYIRESELRALGPGDFDHIIMVSSDKIAGGEEADARTIVGYTLLEDILESSQKAPHIIMELVDPDNEGLIKDFSSETMIGPLILSNMLSTIAMRRELFCVYNELFTVGGAEIIFRAPADYQLGTTTITFGDLENHIKDFQDTVLGYMLKNESGQTELKLNVPRHQPLKLTDQTRLVVLSTV